MGDFQQRIGPSFQTTVTFATLADARLGLDDDTQALRDFQESLRLCERVLGADHSACGHSISGIAEIHRRQGKLELALTEYERAMTILEKTLGATDPELVRPLLGIGRIALARHAPASARPPLARALAISERQQDGGIELAYVRVALAEALWAMGEPEQAVAQATRARVAYLALGAAAERPLTALTAWLDAHPAPSNKPQ